MLQEKKEIKGKKYFYSNFQQGVWSEEINHSGESNMGEIYRKLLSSLALMVMTVTMIPMLTCPSAHKPQISSLFTQISQAKLTEL